MADFSTSTDDDTVDLPSSEKPAEYSLQRSVGIYPVVGEKLGKHWDFGKPECTVIEFDFSG